MTRASRENFRAPAPEPIPWQDPAAHRTLKAPANLKPRVLLVMARQDRPSLLECLKTLGIEVAAVGSCAEARRCIQAFPDIRAVLTDMTLPDGNWRTVVDVVVANCTCTEVVLLAPSRIAGLRQHVRESRVYDLLPEPYTPGETGRIVGGAVLTGYRRRLGLVGGAVQPPSMPAHSHPA